MAVPEQTPYIEHIANGISTQFSVPFQCLSKNTLIVSIDGVETLSQLWDFDSGEIIFITAPSNNSTVSIKRTTSLKREVTYNSFSNSMLPTVFNGDFDRIWHALQEQGYKLGQYDFDYEYAVDTANQAFQKAETAIESANEAYDLANQIQPILKGGTGGTTAQEARTNLDVHSKEEVIALVQTGGEGSVLGVSGGGTGGITAQEARTNLNVHSKEEVNTAINSAKAGDASTTQKGILQIATNAEVQAGTSTVKAITPSALQYKLNFKYSNVAGSRLFSTNYTNATDENLYIGVATTALYNTSLTLRATITQNSVATVVPMSAVANAASVTLCGYVVVPPRAAYKIDVCATDGTVLSGYTVGSWAEGKI